MIKVELTIYEAELLNRPINGKGGIQDLMRKLQRHIKGTTLMIKDEDVPKIKQYCKKYGKTGGFQQRLKPILRAMDAEKYNTKLFETE